MKNVALGALFVGLVACGGNGNNPEVIVPMPDGPDMPPGACNPLMNTGCNAGEKCTWIRDQIDPQPVGHIGCAPDGTIALGGTNCEAPGGLGADQCVAKSICIGRGAASVCEGVCDPQMPTATNGCVTGESACSRYSGLFVVAGAIAFGACDAVCNILTQERLGSQRADFCGGDGTNRGCYGGGDAFEEFTCAGTPMEARALIDGDNAFGPTANGDDAFTNGCAAGNLPFFFEDAGDMTVLCTGVCAPSSNGTVFGVPAVAGGPTNATQAKGDPAASGFLLGATPLVGPGNLTCAQGKKGNVAVGSLECKRIWPFNNDGMQFLPGANNNTVGVCFNHAKFDDAATPEDESPACVSLTEAEANSIEPGCGDDTNFVATIPAPGQPRPKHIEKFMKMRLGGGGVAKAHRHHFE